MTHEAETANFAMSLVDDAAEAAFCASVNKAKLREDQFSASAGKSEREIRMSFGRWSNRDKLEWSCGSCTFLNQPLFLSCEMCGEARPEQDEDTAEVAVPAEARETENIIFSPERQREIFLEEEERVLKQERIKEIMALQQGIFNKIREENEEQEEIEDLEGSFAWMDLDETLPIKELLVPASTARVSCGASGKGGKDGGFGKKPSPMDDASGNTLATAAMSSFNGSSRFSLDWSSNSQHSRLGSVSARNSAIPDQALASLKEESGHGSFMRGSLRGMGSSATSQPMPGVQHGCVNFSALTASVEGASARFSGLEDGASGHSVPTGLHGESNHSGASSYGLVGDSNHSSELHEEPGSPDYTRRRGASTSSSSSPLNGSDDGNQEHHKAEGSAEQRPSLVGAMSVTGAPTRKSIRESDGKDLPGLTPIGATAVTGAPTAKSHKESHKDSLFGGESDPDSPKPEGLIELNARKTLFSGMSKTPQAQPEDDMGELRGSLHRVDGARKIPSPSLIPADKKSSLTGRDPVFSRNLYTDRKHDASNKSRNKSRSVSPKGKKAEKSSGKGVGIPLLNRMLRKKSHPKATETN